VGRGRGGRNVERVAKLFASFGAAQPPPDLIGGRPPEACAGRVREVLKCDGAVGGQDADGAGRLDNAVRGPERKAWALRGRLLHALRLSAAQEVREMGPSPRPCVQALAGGLREQW